MNVGKSVQKAIEEWGQGDNDSAMLHACNAIDGTAKKRFPSLGNNQRFTRLLRDNYDILGPMGAPGVDIVDTRFPVDVARPKASGGKPDLADVIYGIHRCSHGHGDELPEGFELISDASGSPQKTRMLIERGKIRLSDRIIFSLTAVAVVDPVNKSQRVPNGYYLTFGASEKLFINEWWGRGDEFRAVVATEPIPLVKLDFTNWA